MCIRDSPNREILICREITKYHEEYIRTSVKKLSNVNFSRKGEITVVISETKKENILPGSSEPQDLGSISYKDTETKLEKLI